VSQFTLVSEVEDPVLSERFAGVRGDPLDPGLDELVLLLTHRLKARP